jgi:dihydrofolate reductase
MTTVKADLSISLDGCIAGPNDGPEQGLGEGGERLHEWLFGLASWRERHGLEGGARGTDAEVLDEAFRNVGAVVMGRRMFDLAIDAWGEEPPFALPVFVVTHEAREPLTRGQTTFTFVTEGIEAALARAIEAARGRDVSVAGGADVVRQLLAAGQLDELQLHLVPILLGGGVRLFDGLDPEAVRFEQARVLPSDAVTHVKLRAVRG